MLAQRCAQPAQAILQCVCLTVCGLLLAVWHATAADLHTAAGVHKHHRNVWRTTGAAAAAGVGASRAQVATVLPAGGGGGRWAAKGREEKALNRGCHSSRVALPVGQATVSSSATHAA